MAGKKADLVKRLEFYDRNFGQLKTDRQQDDHSYNIKTPDKASYKDVNADTKLPHVTEQTVHSYLMAYGISMGDKVKSLYREKFLYYVRAATTDSDQKWYLLASCAAEMKKHVRYQIDVLSKDGVILECQCECAVGIGPDAHCKHVQCTLLSLFSFTTSKEIYTRESTTQKLQTFHHCKRFKGSPIKAQNVKLRKSGEGRDLQKLKDFDPRPCELVNCTTYTSSVNNMCINYQSNAQSCSNKSLPMPILQTIPPANLYAVAIDHDYLKDHPEDNFLCSVKVQNITGDDAKVIEEQTRGQSSNKLWFEERSKRITSSNFGRICKLTEKTNKRQLSASLINPRPFSSESVRHGQKYESVAIKAYEKLYCVKTKSCGIFVSTSSPYLASSPDGLVDDAIVVEVKCPFVSRNQIITCQTVPYLTMQDGNLSLNKTHDYFYQVQGQLFCTERKQCHFVVYTFKDMKVIIINRDDTFIDSMVKQLSEFYSSHFRKVLLDYQFYCRIDNFNFYS